MVAGSFLCEESMAIDPSSDIVLDVAKAADPARAAAVAQRLNALGATAGAGAGAADFADTLAATAPTIANAPSSADARARFAAEAATTTNAVDEKAAKARTDFEAVMLNNFVSEMLPKDASSIFGQGLAGDMWKSMLADQVSKQIAKSDTLGIAKRLFANHPLGAASEALEKARRADAAATASAAQMSANSLALPSSADVDAGAVLFASGKRS